MTENKPLTFEQIQKLILDFNKSRGWVNLPPADLAKSIVLEAAELLEFYQWDNFKRDDVTHSSKADKQEIAFEAADVFIYLLEFCHENNIDLLQATADKMQLNESRFPSKKDN